MITKGKFITLEGGEGVGKSTNINHIKKDLESRGIEVLTTREPGGTPMAETLRGLLLGLNGEKVTKQTELLLMFAARSQHVEHVIKPALDAGIWVLSDRFVDSSFAYQKAGRGIADQNIGFLENFVLGALRPDLTILLDAPADISMGRAKRRGELDRIELEESTFFEKVRTGFLERAMAYPDRIKVIDATQPLTAVQKRISLEIEVLVAEHELMLVGDSSLMAA